MTGSSIILVSEEESFDKRFFVMTNFDIFRCSFLCQSILICFALFSKQSDVIKHQDCTIKKVNICSLLTFTVRTSHIPFNDN